MYTLSDIFSFLGVSQGLFIIIALQAIKNKNRQANKYLTYSLSIAVLMLFGRVMMLKSDDLIVWKIGILADTTIFLFGPFMYAYFKQLLTKPTGKVLKWYEYIPAFLNGIFFLWMVLKDQAGFVALYQDGTLPILFFLVEAIGLLSMIFYLASSFKVVQQYSRNKDQQLSAPQKAYPFALLVLGVLSIVCLLWMASFISANVFQYTLPVLNYSTFWIAIPVVIYVIGYYSLQQPQIFRVVVQPIKKSKEPSKNRLGDEKVQQITKRLQYYMEEEKAYLEETLTLKKLADMVDTSTNDLSWLLNQVYETTFYKYVNKYRVVEFMDRVKSREFENKTLLGMAFESGFNSKSAFINSFKAEIGSTPSQFVAIYKEKGTTVDPKLNLDSIRQRQS